MDPLGLVVSVLAIFEIACKLSASAASFWRSIRDARKDMRQIYEKMSDTAEFLTLFTEDLGHGSSFQPGDTPHSQQRIFDIALECRKILRKIESVLRHVRSPLDWSISGKKKVAELVTKLNGHESMLSRYHTVIRFHRINGELSSIRRYMDLRGGVMLDRLIDECRNNTQNILGNIEYPQGEGEDEGEDQQVQDEYEDEEEYQQDQGEDLHEDLHEHEDEDEDEDLHEDEDSEDVRPQVQAEAPELVSEFRPELTPSSTPPTILFRNSLGYEREIRLEQCGTWEQMEKIMKRSYSEDPTGVEQIQNGQYSLFHNREVIEPALWADWVQPGVSVDLHLWDEFIKFEDGSGEEFNIPWIWVETWEGIEDWLNETFLDDEDIGPALEKGHYDLTGPDNIDIQPTTWEQLVKPGMSITLSLWSMEEKEPPKGRRKKKQIHWFLRVTSTLGRMSFG